MNTPHIDVICEGVDTDFAVQFAPKVESAIVQSTVTANLDYPNNAELSVMLANDATLRKLNLQWRSIDKATNVLSFPGTDLQPGEKADVILGDVVISMETTRREAVLENKSFDAHFTHLIVHGFLHLFGYDHETEQQAKQMESLESEILGLLGIPDPYESEQAQ